MPVLDNAMNVITGFSTTVPINTYKIQKLALSIMRHAMKEPSDSLLSRVSFLSTPFTLVHRHSGHTTRVALWPVALRSILILPTALFHLTEVLTLACSIS